MIDIDLLENLGFIIISAAVLVLLMGRLGIPNIVLYILAGLLLGPATGLLEVTHTLELIAEFGIVLLLFLVGLELSIATIKDIGKTAFVAGGVQMSLTALGGFLIAYFFGLSILESIVIAIAVMFSSTVVVIKLLEKRGDISETYGRIAIGVLLVQDLVVVIVLTMVAGLAEPEELALADVATGLGSAFLGMIVLGAVVVLATRYVLPHLLGWIARSTEALFIWSLFWCFLVVFISEVLNLSPEIGAFLAGIALAQLPYHTELTRRVHPLMNFFIAVFFVTLGIQMELGAAIANWPLAVTLTVFVMVAKPLIFFWILPRLGHGEETSFRTGITLAQISEFSLIFAALALANGLIDEVLLSLITLVGLLTFGLSSFLINFNEKIYQRVREMRPLAIFGAIQQKPVDETEKMTNHVIVVGMNTMGRRLVEHLSAAGETVLAVDIDRKKLEEVSVPTLYGDAIEDEVLASANVEEAKLLVSALNIEETNNLLAYRCRVLGVPCSIHAFDRSVVEDLMALDVDYLIHSKREGARQFLHELKEREVVAI